MTADEAVYARMERMALLRAYSGKMRRAIVSAANAIRVGDSAYALRILDEALATASPDGPTE